MGIGRFLILGLFVVISSLAFGLEKEEKEAIKAIKAGDIVTLKSYMDKYPDVNCEFSNGKTGLYYAIIHDQYAVAEFLLVGGADPDKEVTGFSTLYWAIKNNRQQMVRLLIEYGAEVNKPDHKQNTPLIYAAKMNNKDICKLLIDRGANPLHENANEKTASDHIAYNDQSPAYMYLLKMEELYAMMDSVPTHYDGPYISWEENDRLRLTYYEHKQEENLTRIVEKTTAPVKNDTIISGYGWDKNTYRIMLNYTPGPTVLKTQGDIFAIGDIHGRYYALLKLLMKNGIIDADYMWAFGQGHLVLLGDEFDRGKWVTDALWFLYELSFQAREAGGNVHVMLGNHEVMAMTGDHRYINDKYRYFTEYMQIDYSQLFEKNTVLGKWLRSQNVVLQINDIIFMHAGISPQFALYNYDYAEINSRIQDYLYTDYAIPKHSPEAHILGPFGPQWYRGYKSYSNMHPEITQEFIDSYLESKGLSRMILGHNEQPVITPSYDGKVISVDVKIDESGETAQGLLISGEGIFICDSAGNKERVD